MISQGFCSLKKITLWNLVKTSKCFLKNYGIKSVTGDYPSHQFAVSQPKGTTKKDDDDDVIRKPQLINY